MGSGPTLQQTSEVSGISKGGTLAATLEDLETSDFIRRYVPFGKKRRGTIYQLIDPFTLFYLRFMDDGLREGFWQANYGAPRANAWRGYAFELVCLLHERQIRQALGIGAIQLLLWRRDYHVACDFLQSVGAKEAQEGYRRFIERIPPEWFACYMGTFPERDDDTMHVECIPTKGLQRAYADDPALLERHLRQAGMEAPSSLLLEQCQTLAQAPFRLEFQFNVDVSGSLSPVFAASVRFAWPSDARSHAAAFEVDGDAGELMTRIEQWGLADSRWKLLEQTVFAKIS